MARVKNPFIVTGKIEPTYFCDRIEESARLVKSITNGNNMVIISPRRMGKTGLIQFCYEKPEIKNEFYTFFIDILHTSSLREFTYLLGREIYETLLPRSKKMTKLFLQTIKSISGKFGFDPMTNLPTFNIELGDIDRPEYTLDEIFRYLAAADRPCIVAIDEFQQVAKYPEKNIEALLRTHIQKIRNSNFIFAGSERHMMQEMFLSASRPFYHSADMLELKAIAPEIYIPFIVQHFESRERRIEAANSKLADYMQSDICLDLYDSVFDDDDDYDTYMGQLFYDNLVYFLCEESGWSEEDLQGIGIVEMMDIAYELGAGEKLGINKRTFAVPCNVRAYDGHISVEWMYDRLSSKAKKLLAVCRSYIYDDNTDWDYSLDFNC